MASPQAVRLFDQIYAKIDGQVRNIVNSMLPSVDIAAQDDGTVIANDHRIMNFQGPGVVVSDEPALRRVNVYVPGAPTASTSTTVASGTSAKAKSLWSAGTGSSAAYDAAVLADTPWGYWKLDEASGSTVVDSSGGGHNGTYNGTANPVTGPWTGWGAQFFGTAYPHIAGVAAFTSTFAVEGWMKLSLAGNFGSLAFSLVNSADTQGVELGAEEVGGCGRNPALAIYGPNFGWSCTTSNAFFDSEWTYFVYQVEADGHSHLYWRCPSFSSTTTYDWGAHAVNPITSPGLNIGCRPDNSVPFKGGASHFAYYTHALTPTQIDAHWTAAGPGGGGAAGNNPPPANWYSISYTEDATWTAAVAANQTSGQPPPTGTTAVWKTAAYASSTEADLFRQTFTPPAGTISDATLVYAADGYIQELRINGTIVATKLGSPSWVSGGQSVSVSPSLLLPGSANVIAVWVVGENPSTSWGAWSLTINYVSAGTDTRYIPYSLMDAKGDLIAGTADNAAARVAVGTNGKVLTADSTAAGGVSWQTAAGGGMTDPMTTAGDLIIRNGSNVTSRLGIGSSGQVLTVSSGAPAWAAGGGGSLTSQSTFLTSTLNMGSASTWMDVLSMSCAAGTWCFWAQYTINASISSVWDVRLTDGTTTYVASETYSNNGYGSFAVAITGLVFASTTTVKLQAASSASGGTRQIIPSLLIMTTVGNVSTYIHALKIA